MRMRIVLTRCVRNAMDREKYEGMERAWRQAQTLRSFPAYFFSGFLAK